MIAYIYQRTRNVMQSGKAKAGRWHMRLVPQHTGGQRDRLTGWYGRSQPETQLKLSFPDCQRAIDYAQAQGYAYIVQPTSETRLKKQDYAMNFSHTRRSGWTH